MNITLLNYSLTQNGLFKLFLIIVVVSLIGCSSTPEQEKDAKVSTKPSTATSEVNKEEKKSTQQSLKSKALGKEVDEVGSTTENTPEPALTSYSETLEINKVIHQYPLPNSSQTIAYYFPQQQDLKGVLVFYDAHARGSLPVTFYQKVAQEHGYALVGSNFSSNTVPYPQIQQHHQRITAQLQEWGITKNFIFPSGFSGGARAATQLAFDFNHKAIIGCGAGLFNNDDSPLQSRYYYGFVGTEDFNFSEMMQLKEKFKSSFYFFMDVFEGGHAWPQPQDFSKALHWLTLQQMKMEQIPKNENLVNDWYLDYLDYLNTHSFDQVITKLTAIERGFSYFNQLMPTLAFDDMKENFIATNQYGKFALKKPVGNYVVSVWRNKAYGGITEQQPFSWWQEQWEELQAEEAKNKITIIVNGFKQAEGYFSLLLYMSVNSALKNENVELAREHLKAFELVDKNNPDVLFLRGLLHLQEGNTELAKETFAKMANKGFDKVSVFETHELMLPYANQDWHQKLKGKVWENALREPNL